MHSVTEVVFGKKYNRNPGDNIMNEFRKLLDESIFFQTYREEPVNDTFNFTPLKLSNEYF